MFRRLLSLELVYVIHPVLSWVASKDQIKVVRKVVHRLKQT